MLLVASAFLITLLQYSNAQDKPSITPADCDTIEREAGVALDLVNRHRRDGYVFGLFRVADAHQLHIGNSSVLYLTLDVLETECSVLSRRHWESCEYSDSYLMDFGQCKIITYTSHLLRKPQLYGFNCTLSPVPPDLLECKDCPVKIEALEVTEEHKNIAAKALKKFNREGNHTNHFAVAKVEKVFKMTASHEGHILRFSIKETNCSKSMQQADQALECDFLDYCHAHMGFCKARIISDADEPDGTDLSCEIYHPWQHHYGQRGNHSGLGKPHRHHHHHHFGHRRHHRHHHRHECPPSSQSRPEDPEHNHNISKEDQDSHEGPAPIPPQDGPHHHHPPHHHGPHCPPPPPPPPGPYHHHPSHHHGPHCPPPPPPGPHHPHPPHRHGPHCPPPPPPHGPHHPPPPGHPPHFRHHFYRHHSNKTSMWGKHFPFHVTGTVYHIPVLNQQDSLTPPTANFPELSQRNPHSSSTGEGNPFTGSRLKEVPEVPGFPDHSTQSKSCPGNPKLVFPKILPLFPHSSMAENSPK
ncbi:PREDICTED: histidine-rich glycoprotein [Acanthisitta chloris]|uniref:histidine-rich glycoprotein n=1 Tax=Acanthisitta chloris TaxID=57068 RepID=UPI0004F0EC18|nr:PREDICTED: histidine-rich glycoprotein [Acanthisitta chloris]